jgi:hypothetical protein
MHQPWVRPHGVSRGQARVAFQFHGSLDLGIIVLRYVTLCNGRSRAVSSLARPGCSGLTSATDGRVTWRISSRSWRTGGGPAKRHVGRAARQPALRRHSRCVQIVRWPLPRGVPGADVAGQVVGCSFTNASAAPRRLFSAIVPSCTLWILSSNTRNGGVASNGTANRPVQVVSVADYGLAWLDRTRPERRISLPSSVRVPRSKLRNRIAQLPSSRWASAIVSFRIASDR